MKSSQISRLPLNGLNKLPISSEEIENSLHAFSDREWLAVRHQQMDVLPNCIFPVRNQVSISTFMRSLRAVLVAAIKLPVRL
ncbi:MAG: hypothetical protein ABIO46_04485 [Chitinophagales bacterium]